MTPSITEDAILTALRQLLLVMLPVGVEVIQGQPNRVPEPQSEDFIVFTPLTRAQIATNTGTWDVINPPVHLDLMRPTQYVVQLDIHGPNGSDNAQTIVTLWRSEYACQAVDTSIFQPLFATDGRQMPFINGENQYENRWTCELTLQANPVVSTQQPFADSVSVTNRGVSG